MNHGCDNLAKRKKRTYAHEGSIEWMDEDTGFTFYREPGWTPSNEPNPNPSRKWKKMGEW